MAITIFSIQFSSFVKCLFQHSFQIVLHLEHKTVSCSCIGSMTMHAFLLLFFIANITKLFGQIDICGLNKTADGRDVIQADQYVERDRMLLGFKFWTYIVADIGVCARTCLRVRRCKSFNYQLQTSQCDMNDHPLEGYSRTVSNGWVWSLIEKWPKEVCKSLYYHI